MILQELVSYYEALADMGKMPRQGWAVTRVSYALNIAESGELLDVIPLTQEIQRGKKAVLEPQSFPLPYPVKRASGISANFLCDNSTYMLGVDSKGRPDRSKDCFAAAAELHKQVLEDAGSPAAHAILAFFKHWIPQEAEIHPALTEYLADIVKGANLIFRTSGQYAHEDAAVREAWQCYCERGTARETIDCLVTGEPAVPARLHPSIKGVRDAPAMGASLVSFNADAYASYGKEQGLNAPVGEYAAFAYGTALNHLLQDREHTQHLGDTTLVFWAKGGGSAPQDMFATMLAPERENVLENEMKDAMVKLSRGQAAAWGDETLHPETPFFVLGLAPNAARLSVRFFLRNTLGVFARQMLAHQERLEITRPAFDKREQLSFWSLLRETVNEKSRDRAPSPVMAGDLIRAVLSGGSYPATLLNSVVLRIRAEREVTRGRVAILKAYYLKNPNPGCPKEVLTVQLNNSNHVPYRLGRAFSILEAIQQAASPGLNATIKDKYFNAASATPATIFPLLINLAQKHLRKIDGGLRVHLEKQLGEVLNIVEAFPTRLTLPEQGAFQLGYYHQTQKRYEKKEETRHA